MECVLTLEELEKLCGEWVEVLGLTDWRIFVSIKRTDDMNLSCVDGEVKYTFIVKSAIINVLDHIDYPSEMLFPQDMERILVHELLHLKMDRIFHAKGDYTEMQHQLLNDMAVALVRVKREKSSQCLE
jgi:hypothetical protein